MPIKVLVISDYRDYHAVRPEATVFIELAKKGFQIHIMTYKSSAYAKEFEEAGIKVTDFHPEKKFDRTEINTIREVLQKENTDILHLFNSPSIVNGIQAAKNLPVKVVLYRGYSGNIHWYDPVAYTKFLHPRVDKIVCNSIGVEEVFHRQLFFNKEKAVTINKGHKLEWYEGYAKAGIREELGIPEDAFLLINVANNRKMKGIPYLLKAFNLVSNDLPIHLLLVGRDMDTRENLHIINRGNKKNKVHFLGFRKNVLNIVADSDAFVLPSIKGESITKSVIEAMSLGVTPIISDIAGNRELVIHNESGIVFPSKDFKKMSEAIEKVYHDQVFNKKLGENAQKRIANELNQEQTVLKTQKLYEELVSQKA